MKNGCKIAIACCGDRSYFLQQPFSPIIALTSFKQHFGDYFDYFCFSKFESESDVEFINQFSFHAVSIDYHHIFTKPDSESFWGTFPREGFWIGMLAEKLYRMGYDYTLTVDGDVYCNKRFNLDFFDNDEIDFFGVNHPRNPGGKPEPKNFEGQINSGVMMFNNRNCSDKKLSEAYLKLYRSNDYWSEQPLYQDIIEAGSFSFQALDRSYNFMLRNIHALGENKGYRKEDVKIAHFLKGKPWQENTPPHFQYELRNYFVEKYMALKNTLNLA